MELKFFVSPASLNDSPRLTVDDPEGGEVDVGGGTAAVLEQIPHERQSSVRPFLRAPIGDPRDGDETATYVVGDG